MNVSAGREREKKLILTKKNEKPQFFFTVAEDVLLLSY
jgi:hypothetical protein